MPQYMAGLAFISTNTKFLKLADQILIDSTGILRNVETQIMGLPTSVKFEVNDLFELIPTYATLVIRSSG